MPSLLPGGSKLRKLLGAITRSPPSVGYSASRGGFYAAQRRPPCKRAQEGKAIAEIHADSRETYGAPRVQAMLARRGIHVGRKRVARLMRRRSLSGLGRRKRDKTTVRIPRDRHRSGPGPTRVEPDRANRLWVADLYLWPSGSAARRPASTSR